ncbi:MAG: DUF4410 domain-containing protein [Alphaproteobacteria bacterium]|nr:DUF4410 domain-containing protein [Alphaproteobacteria bacterium]
MVSSQQLIPVDNPFARRPRAATHTFSKPLETREPTDRLLGGLVMMNRLPEFTFGICLVAMLAASPGATAAPVTTPSAVYVSDFDLTATKIQQPEPVPKSAPTSEHLRYGRPKPPPTPEQRARYLVDLMSRSLLDDLHHAGIPAQRLPLGAPLPSSGWLIRGGFLEADADGRLHRAVIGAGGGSKQLQVVAAIDQLGAGAPQPLYTIDGAAPSGKLPGAIVTLNPYLALGRFVLAGLDLDRNVKNAAAEIADQVKMRFAVSRSDKSETK